MTKDSDHHVLMVEDNRDDVDLTLRSFKKNAFPYEFVIARDGAEALDYLFGTGAYSGTAPRPPALILLDLNLPKVRGLEVLKRVRTDLTLKQVPVVILTSSNEENDRAQAEALGADLYIRKPIDFNDFDAIAKQVQNFLSSTPRRV